MNDDYSLLGDTHSYTAQASVDTHIQHSKQYGYQGIHSATQMRGPEGIHRRCSTLCSDCKISTYETDLFQKYCLVLFMFESKFKTHGKKTCPLISYIQ